MSLPVAITQSDPTLLIFIRSCLPPNLRSFSVIKSLTNSFFTPLRSFVIMEFSLCFQIISPSSCTKKHGFPSEDCLSSLRLIIRQYLYSFQKLRLILLIQIACLQSEVEIYLLICAILFQTILCSLRNAGRLVRECLELHGFLLLHPRKWYSQVYLSQQQHHLP